MVASRGTELQEGRESANWTESRGDSPRPGFDDEVGQTERIKGKNGRRISCAFVGFNAFRPNMPSNQLVFGRGPKSYSSFTAKQKSAPRFMAVRLVHLVYGHVYLEVYSSLLFFLSSLCIYVGYKQVSRRLRPSTSMLC